MREPLFRGVRGSCYEWGLLEGLFSFLPFLHRFPLSLPFLERGSSVFPPEGMQRRMSCELWLWNMGCDNWRGSGQARGENSEENLRRFFFSFLFSLSLVQVVYCRANFIHFVTNVIRNTWRWSSIGKTIRHVGIAKSETVVDLTRFQCESVAAKFGYDVKSRY